MNSRRNGNGRMHPFLANYVKAIVEVSFNGLFAEIQMPLLLEKRTQTYYFKGGNF